MVIGAWVPEQALGGMPLSLRLHDYKDNFHAMQWLYSKDDEVYI